MLIVCFTVGEILKKRIKQSRYLASNPPEKIHAIHDDDLEKFLGSLGLLSSITKGQLHCKFCREVITLQTLQSIFPDSGNISVVCNKPQCTQAYFEYQEK